MSTAVATVIPDINARVAQLPASGTIDGMQLQQQVASLRYLSQTSVFLLYQHWQIGRKQSLLW